MANSTLINLTFEQGVPGADEAAVKRYYNWDEEVYNPMLQEVNGVMGADLYRIIRETPEYPPSGSIRHHQNLDTWEAYDQTQTGSAIRGEMEAWIKRRVIEFIWSVLYELKESFSREPSSGDKDTRIENAPVMHLEAYRLSPEDREKYIKWFDEYGSKIFIPLFLESPGLKRYDWFKDTGRRRRTFTRESEYPPYLSIMYFDDIKSFETYTKSASLIAFNKALRTVFPYGLNYKWYVQYQLVKSWRK
jgi:hypothetical protein